MKQNYLHLLMILNSTGNLNGMRKYGYEFDEILILLKELIEEGLVLRTSEKIGLTISGHEKLKEYEDEQKRIKKGDANGWILPDYKSELINKASISEPFIPNKISLERIIKKVKKNM